MSEDTDSARTLAAGRAAISILRTGLASGRLSLGKKEIEWLDKIEAEFSRLPASEGEAITEGRARFSGDCDFSAYGPG